MKGRVAIVTGAGRGLGRAYALDFARRGARLVVNARSSADCDAVVAAATALGAEAIAHPGDLVDPAVGESLSAAALARFGACDILIANAGAPEARSLHKQTVPEFAKAFAANFDTTLNVLLPCYRAMREAGYGRIVVSTSAAGLHGVHGLPAYGASKAAVLGLMRTVAIEGAGQGVRCNALAPFAATGMTDAHLPPALKPRLDPAFVAPVAAWLAGEACPVNGEIFVAGAGRVRRAAVVEGDGVAGEDLAPAALTAALGPLRDIAAGRTFADGNVAFEDFLASDRAARLG
jgi:NAD(P)-dependent dehydrogenase (short-subunit alcohol dehydrogenase family)